MIDCGDFEAPALSHFEGGKLVFEPSEEEDSGLVDARGHPLVRRRQRLGFDLGWKE